MVYKLLMNTNGNHVFSFHYGLLKIKHIFQIKVILRVFEKLNP